MLQKTEKSKPTSTKKTQTRNEPKPTGSSIHLQKEEMVSGLFRNLSRLTCNAAAVRWIRGAAWATGASPATGEDLSPSTWTRGWKVSRCGSAPQGGQCREVWARGMWSPSGPARGPRYFCCARSELDVRCDGQVPPGWLRYLHMLIAKSRCLCLPHSLLQGETARTGFGSTCAVLVTSQAAISSPVAMETTRPQHQLAVQYIIYLFFFT